MLAGASLPAQDIFYREASKQGRTYVFASAAQYEGWEATGAITAPLTREGYGPAHETVVFDGPEAVRLYVLRHPAAAQAPTKGATARLSWGDGKTTLEMERLLVNLSNRMQLRWVEEMPDQNTPLPGAAKGESKGSFRFARARTKLDGWVYRKGFEYEIQLDWADPTSIVQDLVLNWDISGKRLFQVRFGQFKIPFGRQAISSAMYQQFVDRSIVAVEYEKIRDQGLQVWGQIAGSRLEYRAGIFNGVGRQRTLGTPSTGNDNTKYRTTPGSCSNRSEAT